MNVIKTVVIVVAVVVRCCCFPPHTHTHTVHKAHKHPQVWLNGMEVTQFTYFQQAGGKPLTAPAVEITYGLERILMNLQGVSHFKDIQYAPGITYGELFMQNEYEMSVYNLDEADVEDQRARFALFEKVRPKDCLLCSFVKTFTV